MLQIDRRVFGSQGEGIVLRLNGDVDEESTRELRMSLVDCLKDGNSNIVLNLTKMKFISYMGIGVFVERLRQFRNYSGDMKLVGVNLYTERLFRMTGVTSLFDYYDNEQEAIDAYLQNYKPVSK